MLSEECTNALFKLFVLLIIITALQYSWERSPVLMIRFTPFVVNYLHIADTMCTYMGIYCVFKIVFLCLFVCLVLVIHFCLSILFYHITF